MRKLLAISILGLLCYYGVSYYNYMNSGVIYVDPNLETLVEEWKSEMTEHGLPYEGPYKRIRRIEVVDDYGVSNLAGQCNHTTGEIGIGKEQILKGYYTTKVILWHELGHYVFDLDHVDGISIMNGSTRPEGFYKENWEELKASYLKQIADGI